MDEWLSTEQAAKLMAVSQPRIRAMLSDGLLAGEKRGRDLYISKASLDTQRSTYGQLSTAQRIRVFVRDNLTCQECQLHEDDPTLFHVHHKIERANSGTNELENLETLCCDCHKARHAPVEGEEKNTKPCCFRFPKETMWAIADLIAAKYGRDKTEAVGRAILEAKERLDGSVTRTVASVALDITAHDAVAAVPPPAPFSPMCRHCGEKFGAWNRNASLCPDCKATHHSGDPRDCGPCTENVSI